MAMNKWQIDIETHSRDDALKVCALLVKGIGNEAILSRRSKVIIAGTPECGKGAIVDAMTAAMSDDLSPYKLSYHSLYEERPCHAMDETIVRAFNASNHVIKNSFRHDFMKRVQTSSQKCSELLQNRDIGFDAPPSKDLHGFTGVDFETCHLVYSDADGIEALPDENCLFIAFDNGNNLNSFEWHRTWSIHIMDQRLQTPQMAEILNHLLCFHERRQARMEYTEQQTNSPV